MAKQILGKVVPIAKGEYNSSTQYEILDIVTHNGSSYIAKTNVKGQTPTNTTYWQLLAKVGDKPVYGVDYLTEQEMDAIVQDIINDSTNTFNQNVTAKTNEFNTNATSKTNAFNQNAENKTTTFNNNASDKTSTFNTNASDKTSNFNNNATTKTTAFDTNAQNKTNDFNTNATSSTDDFDRNAAAKTTTFNNNATAKQDTYDENHTSKLGEYNTNATAKTTAFNENYQEKLDDFNSHVEDYDKRITTNSNRIQHIETDLFDSGNATGSSITLNDSTLAEFIDIKEDGVCEQVTTTGKNLFDGELEQGGIQSGENLPANTTLRSVNYCEVLPNTNYAFSINNSLNKVVVTYYDNDKVWIDQGDVTGYQSQTGLFTTPQNAKYLRFRCFAADYNLFQNGKIMLEPGTTATSYEPYTGLQPSPSPDYPQPIAVLDGSHNIIVTGKNLFDTSLLPITKNGVTISKDSNGNVILNGTPTISTGYIEFVIKNDLELSEGTYTISLLEKMAGIGVAINTTLPIGGVLNLTMSDTIKNKTATIEDLNNGQISINVRYDVGTLNNYILNPQLEKNSTATSYEPYISSTTEIEIPTGQFAAKINDTYKDQIRIVYNEDDGEYHAYLDKKVGKVVLDGSENWIENTAYNGIFMLTKSDIIQEFNDIYIKSDYFRGVSNSYFNTNINEIDNSITNFGNTRIFIADKNFQNNLSGFKNWLLTHNVTVYYAFAIPTTIDLGVIDMPTTYYPITNVFTDSELNPVLEVNYYRDFKTTIQTMQNNITTLQSNYLSLDQRVTALENTNTQSNVASVESEGE